MPGERPKAPFDTWPLQIYERDFGFAWYTKPAAFVFQATAEHGDLAFVDRFSDLIDRVLAERRDEVRAASGLFIFHDWRSTRGYDKEARARAIERMKARDPGYARRTVVAVNPRSRLLRMAVEAVNLFAAVTAGSKIELVTDPSVPLEGSGIIAPENGARFP